MRGEDGFGGGLALSAVGAVEEASSAEVVVQATVRLRSVVECERVVRLAHRRGVASAMAYEGPESGARSIFVMFMDEAAKIEAFLPELQAAAPEARISISRERLLHASPPDFLRGGALEGKPFRVELRNVGWVFAGGALGGGARVLLDAAARYLTPGYAAFPWGTMAVNMLGSFFIAVLGALIFERFIGERERMFWILGFLGSFTTFSAFISQIGESARMSPLLGASYAAGSILLGLAAALLGIWTTRKAIR